MNSCILIGRLTKDPELRYAASTGTAVSTFSIAVDRPFTGKDGKKQTDFFNIVVWGKSAENVANYLSKGKQVAIRGSIHNRNYETQNSGKRYVTEIIAENVQFLGSKPNANPNEKDAEYEEYQSIEEENMPF